MYEQPMRSRESTPEFDFSTSLFSFLAAIASWLINFHLAQLYRFRLPSRCQEDRDRNANPTAVGHQQNERHKGHKP